MLITNSVKSPATVRFANYEIETRMFFFISFKMHLIVKCFIILKILKLWI